MNTKSKSKYKKITVLILICFICIICIVFNWQHKNNLNNLKKINVVDNNSTNNSLSLQTPIDQNNQINFLNKTSLTDSRESSYQSSSIRLDELEIQKAKAKWYKSQANDLFRLNNLIFKYYTNQKINLELDYFLKNNLPEDVCHILNKLKTSDSTIQTNKSFKSKLIFPKNNSFFSRFLTIRKNELDRRNLDSEIFFCFNQLLTIFATNFTDKD